jgi:hypothetical protein
MAAAGSTTLTSSLPVQWAPFELLPSTDRTPFRVFLVCTIAEVKVAATPHISKIYSDGKRSAILGGCGLRPPTRQGRRTAYCSGGRAARSFFDVPR